MGTPLGDVLNRKDFNYKFQKAYVELNDELSFLIGVSVDRHALILDTFDVIVLYYFTCWQGDVHRGIKYFINRRAGVQLVSFNYLVVC